jgi:RNA polymerase sigma-70 factor (ECF subfamily)
VLFRAHAPFVWRVLRRYGVAVADVEDVCQEVFTVVYRRLAEFEGRSQLRTWLYEIARRTAFAQRRRQTRLPLVTELEPPAPCDEAPDSQVDKQRALVWLHWALTRLDEEKREAFVLYELEQLTLAEVARAMNCSINAVHYRVLAARKELVTLSRRRMSALQLGEQGGARKVAGAQSREGV